MPHIPLLTEVVPGDRISDQTIDACWQLRRSLIDLRAEVPAEDDARVFRNDLRTAYRAGFLYDTSNQLMGFSEVRIYRRPQGLVVRGSYGFTHPSIRRHPALMMLFLRLLGEVMVRERVFSYLFVGEAYPQGFRPFAYGATGMWLVGEVGAPDWVLRAQKEVIPDVYGERWEAERTRIRMRTIPRPFELRHPSDRQLLERYERVNPQWRDGYGAALVLRMNSRTVRELIGKFARRQLRRMVGR